MKKLSLLLALVLGLAACNNSDVRVSSITPPAGATQLVPDAFTTQVGAVVAAGADDEAPAIESIVATTPEDREPAAL